MQLRVWVKIGVESTPRLCRRPAMTLKYPSRAAPAVPKTAVATAHALPDSKFSGRTVVNIARES